MKRPVDAERPFPRRCHTCGETKVVLSKIDYAAEIRSQGRLLSFTVRDLELPICKNCGEKYFTENTDRQIESALQEHVSSTAESMRHRALHG